MYNEVLEKTLISEEQLKTRISELAKQIEKDYEGKSPVIVGVLKGSVMFYTDLVRQIDLPLTVDFMSISSYGAGVNSTGEVKIMLFLVLSAILFLKTFLSGHITGHITALCCI